MLLEYIAIEISVLIISSKLIMDFVRNFGILKRILALFLFPLILFVIGFLFAFQEIKK